MPNLPEPSRWTIHLCSECGANEGDSPQAGCCAACGVRSEPIPVEVVEARPGEPSEEAVEAENERLKREVAGYKAAMNRTAGERDALLGSGAEGPLADALAENARLSARLAAVDAVSGKEGEDG